MLINQIANLDRWNPVCEINQLQEGLNRIFSSPAERKTHPFSPDFDVWETENGIMLASELPGLERDDIDISVEGNVLTLKGNKKAPGLNEKDMLLIRERCYGEFTRSIKLPYRVNPEQVEARFKNGVLTIKLNRPEEEKPKKINVHAE